MDVAYLVIITGCREKYPGHESRADTVFPDTVHSQFYSVETG